MPCCLQGGGEGGGGGGGQVLLYGLWNLSVLVYAEGDSQQSSGVFFIKVFVLDKI